MAGVLVTTDNGSTCPLWRTPPLTAPSPRGQGQETVALVISEGSADLAYFRISGDNIAITNISLVTPEPATFAFTLIGLWVIVRRDIKSRGCDLPSS
jgi:hypothetical protein